MRHFTYQQRLVPPVSWSGNNTTNSQLSALLLVGLMAKLFSMDAENTLKPSLHPFHGLINAPLKFFNYGFSQPSQLTIQRPQGGAHQAGSILSIRRRKERMEDSFQPGMEAKIKIGIICGPHNFYYILIQFSRRDQFFCTIFTPDLHFLSTVLISGIVYWRMTLSYSVYTLVKTGCNLINFPWVGC